MADNIVHILGLYKYERFPMREYCVLQIKLDMLFNKKSGNFAIQIYVSLCECPGCIIHIIYNFIYRAV